MEMFENAIDAIDSNPKATALFRNKDTYLFVAIENPSNCNGQYGLGVDWKFVCFASDLKKQEPKRTKVEYVKVEDSIFDLRSSLESGELYYKDIDDKFYEISGESQLVNCFDSSRVYRRIETEITERDEFIDAALESVKLKHIIVVKDAIENMFDSGKFKLVD